MRSERAVGRALCEAFKHGAIKREQVVVCSKGGYLTFDVEMRPADPRKWIQDNYVKAGIFSWADFVAGCHCMTPAYLKNQVIVFWAEPLFVANYCIAKSKNHRPENSGCPNEIGFVYKMMICAISEVTHLWNKVSDSD